jgi:hypothetical protein
MSRGPVHGHRERSLYGAVSIGQPYQAARHKRLIPFLYAPTMMWCLYGSGGGYRPCLR